MEFVDRASQIQSSQQRITSDFSSAQDVASAARFNFGEAEQFSHPPVRIAPYPAVNRTQNPIEAC
jgi:hypothetical protein